MKTSIPRVYFKPLTRLGRWSIGLETAFTLLFAGNIPLNLYLIQPMNGPVPPYYTAFILLMLACGILGGIIGMRAILREHERSLVVWLSTTVGMAALLIFLNELLQGLQLLLRGGI